LETIAEVTKSVSANSETVENTAVQTVVRTLQAAHLPNLKYCHKIVFI
jgi:hypothetical protein